MRCDWSGEAALGAARRMAEEGLGGAARQLLDASQARVPVDSGALRGSARIAQEGLTARVGYGTDHSLFVHEGGGNMHGRPFLREALDKTDLCALVARVLRL